MAIFNWASGIVPNRPSIDLTLCAAKRRKFGASAGGKTWERASLTAPKVSSHHPPVSHCFGTVPLGSALSRTASSLPSASLATDHWPLLSHHSLLFRATCLVKAHSPRTAFWRGRREGRFLYRIAKNSPENPDILRNENSITVRIGKTGTPCAHGTKTFSGRATKALGNHPIVPLREVVVKEDRHVLFESRRRFRSGRIITRNDIHSDCQARLRLSSLDQFLD